MCMYEETLYITHSTLKSKNAFFYFLCEERLVVLLHILEFIHSLILFSFLFIHMFVIGSFIFFSLSSYQ